MQLNDKIAQLEQLRTLLTSGVLTREEFESMKARVLDASRSGPGPSQRSRAATGSGAEPLSDEDWLAVLAVLGDPLNPEELAAARDQFELMEAPAQATIPPLGLCVVLQGEVMLGHRGEPLGLAPAGSYFFEERLMLEDIEDIDTLEAHAREPVRLAVLRKPSWDQLATDLRQPLGARLHGDLLSVHMHEFQQPINCCNITAVAFAMTALGFPTDVNSIFKRCQLPAAYVVNDGLTLAELFDVACTYIMAQGLSEKITAECHHFDTDVIGHDDLVAALNESDDSSGADDIFIANFGVATAHANAALKGGHFALLAKHNRQTGIVHMVDVNPEKYQKVWPTNTQRLHRAMVERDGSSRRGRGLLRLSARSGHGTRLSCLRRECVAVDMTRHIRAPNNDYAKLFLRPAINLSSLGAVSLSLRALGVAAVDSDELMRAGNIRYPDLLHYEPSPRELSQVTREYLADVGVDVITSSVRVHGEDGGQRGQANAGLSDPRRWLEAQLEELVDPANLHMLIEIDINRALGCSAIEWPEATYKHTSQHSSFWCVCTGYDAVTRTVTVADTSSATSQMWQAPVDNIFRALVNGQNPAVAVLRRARDAGELRVSDVVGAHPLVLFQSAEDPWSDMLRSVLANIGVTELKVIDVGGYGLGRARLRQQLVAHSGRDTVPYLYLEGQCLGEPDDVLALLKSGELQARLARAGLHVLHKQHTPSLDSNIYGYPKGGLTAPPDAKRNILLCACGSSAADKIPELVERLVDAGHDVKLVPSKRAEHFFEEFGMERILAKIKPSDIYRDDDEWNFRYTEFGMPVRACHLALCDWADCIVVAPVTCNTMGKVAHGVADSILTSVFVAWQYQKKPVIVCPACNTNMWNNITTQTNVGILRRLGARFEGPRSGMLSNGSAGIGMMALPDQILAAVDEALQDLEHRDSWVMRWGALAAAADDPLEWLRIYRTIDEGIVGINIRADETGDTLLHYAAGGEGTADERGISRGVPDLEAARQLIRRGIDIDAKNDFGFTALHVAIMNESPAMVALLLEAGTDASACLSFIHAEQTDAGVRALLERWAESHELSVATPGTVDGAKRVEQQTATALRNILYFTYGSLKRGFPNYSAHADILSDFVGLGVTRQSLPLVVPNEPHCSNPHCPYLHRMASLVHLYGTGERVEGEVYRVSRDELLQLDKLEGYVAPGHSDNTYERRVVGVVVGGKVVSAVAYFIKDGQAKLGEVERGTATFVSTYTLQMAEGVLKPDPTAPS